MCDILGHCAKMPFWVNSLNSPVNYFSIVLIMSTMRPTDTFLSQRQCAIFTRRIDGTQCANNKCDSSMCFYFRDEIENLELYGANFSCIRCDFLLRKHVLEEKMTHLCSGSVII